MHPNKSTYRAFTPTRVKHCLNTCQKHIPRQMRTPVCARSPRYDDPFYIDEKVEEISSLQNSTVKHCVKLRTQKSYRESNRSAILSGADLVRELAHVEFDLLFHMKGNPPPPGAVTGGARVIAVTEGVMQKITGLESTSPSTLAAEVALPSLTDFEAWKPGSLHRLLVLECCQDPGNLGTLLRTALALGWNGVFLLPGCADHFNEKAMRASRGACFKLPIARGTLDDWKRVAKYHNLACIAADLDDRLSQDRLVVPEQQNNSETMDSMIDRLGSANISLVLGSEGQGISDAVLDECRTVSIPMIGEMESLNVASAGSILMWLLGGNPSHLICKLASVVKIT